MVHTMQVNATVERRIPCAAGIKPIDRSPQNQLWVKSPRTGKIITFSDGWFHELTARAPRLVAKVVHARANGLAVVMFTVDELHALVAVAAIVAERCKPQPGPRPLWGGWRQSFSRSRFRSR
jgi:hypothetical protein